MKPDMSKLKDMVYIESGPFIMGSDESPNEKPCRTVELAPFYIDRYPVTNRAYRQFIEDGGYRTPKHWSADGWNFVQARNLQFPLYWLDDHWNADVQPVTGVSWWEACAFAKYLGKQLPTEAQWENAARGTDGRRYPWGDDEPTAEHALYAIDCDPTELRRRSASVYAFPLGASPCGGMDFAGNVGEWCQDNASANYVWDITCLDPRYWTAEEDDHIVRGGSGLHNEDYLRCSSRDYYPPTLRDNIVGFRCVIDEK